jgi:preprotein translocase subunit SecA
MSEALSVPPQSAEAEERAKVANVLGQAFGRPAVEQSNLQYTAPTIDGEGGVERTSAPAGSGGGFANASRNAPCPCGSGKKFKRCHGAPGMT